MIGAVDGLLNCNYVRWGEPCGNEDRSTDVEWGYTTVSTTEVDAAPLPYTIITTGIAKEFKIQNYWKRSHKVGFLKQWQLEAILT